MKFYGFLQDKKWYEDVGHIFVGMVAMWGWIRENDQYPPGKPITLYWDGLANPRNPNDPVGPGEWTTNASICTSGVTRTVFKEDRTRDLYRDFLGYSIGHTLEVVAFIGVIVWLAQ